MAFYCGGLVEYISIFIHTVLALLHFLVVWSNTSQYLYTWFLLCCILLWYGRVHPNIYTHGSRLVAFCCGLVENIPIFIHTVLASLYLLWFGRVYPNIIHTVLAWLHFIVVVWKSTSQYLFTRFSLCCILLWFGRVHLNIYTHGSRFVVFYLVW